jgi:hypothetical protein
MDPRRPLTPAPSSAPEDLEARLAQLERAHDALLEANRALGREAFAKQGSAAAMGLTDHDREVKRLMDEMHALKVRLVEEEQERARVVADRDRLHAQNAELQGRLEQLERAAAQRPSARVRRVAKRLLRR